MKTALAKGIALLIAAALGVVGTFVFQSYYQPKLEAQVGFAEVLIFNVKGDGNARLANLLEYRDGVKVIGSERLEFDSAPSESSLHRYYRITKIVVRNTGWATAKNVRIGLGIPEGVVAQVTTSPNAALSAHQSFPASAENPKYQLLKLDTVPKNDVVVVTVVTIFPIKKQDSHQDDYAPLLFLASDEVADDDQDISTIGFSDAVQTEHGVDPADAPFWRYAVDAHQSFKASPIEGMELGYSAVDDNGNVVEEGKAKYDRKARTKTQ